MRRRQCRESSGSCPMRGCSRAFARHCRRRTYCPLRRAAPWAAARQATSRRWRASACCARPRSRACRQSSCARSRTRRRRRTAVRGASTTRSPRSRTRSTASSELSDVLEELAAARHGRRAVREEIQLLVGLVPELERRARVHDDDAADLDVHPLRRLVQQDGERAAHGDEDLLLRLQMTPPARVGREHPHPRARLRQIRGCRDVGRAPQHLAVRRRALLPLERPWLHDVVAHGGTIPCAVVVTRPEALPPAERTVGQLVAESIRFYGDHFWRALVLGVPPALLTLLTANVPRTVTFILLPALGGAVLSAVYVAASVLVLDAHPPKRRLALAWIAGWLVFVPVPFLVLVFILPALAWLAAFGLVVPALVAEPDLEPRRAARRALQLGRADYVHALGSLATLAILVLLTQGVLAFVLRGAGDLELSTASVFASVVISPLLLLGTALLYVDQASRVE